MGNCIFMMEACMPCVDTYREPTEEEIKKYIDAYYERYIRTAEPIKEPLLPGWMS